MAISIIQSCYINEVGKRDNNEDSVYPLHNEPGPVERLFLVCDGVGGAEKGEVASKLACEQFAAYFREHTQRQIDDKFIDDAVAYVYEAFVNYVAGRTESKDMATTVSLIYFNEDSAMLAHIGDSRIYHIRGGQILFHTTDHSKVNQMIAQGKLTPEEAHNHPEKNVITRAMHVGNAASVFADIKQISDIEQGDVFFLCTDGIIESFTDAEIEQLFSGGKSIVEIEDLIVAKCNIHSSDNFSAYLIEVDAEGNESDKIARAANVTKLPGDDDLRVKTKIITPREQFVDEPIDVDENVTVPSGEGSNKKYKYIAYIAGALLVIVTALLIGRQQFFGPHKRTTDTAASAAHKVTDSLPKTQAAPANDGATKPPAQKQKVGNKQRHKHIAKDATDPAKFPVYQDAGTNGIKVRGTNTVNNISSATGTGTDGRPDPADNKKEKGPETGTDDGLDPTQSKTETETETETEKGRKAL